MKRIRVTVDDHILETYKEDIELLIHVFNQRGYALEKEQACALWRAHSESWAAGWLSMDYAKDQDIFEDVKEFFEEVDE